MAFLLPEFAADGTVPYDIMGSLVFHVGCRAARVQKFVAMPNSWLHLTPGARPVTYRLSLALSPARVSAFHDI